jgi:hypothetical protein
VERHHIENVFARLKSFLRIATRYEKLHRTLAAMVTLLHLHLDQCLNFISETRPKWRLVNKKAVRR